VIDLYRQGMYVLDLQQIDDSMITSVGGKALNLGIMTAAGLPVPPGFCVTTTAYEAVVGDLLSDLIDDLADPGAGDLANLAGQARERVRLAPVPDAVRRSIAEHYAAMGTDVAVAVRSSATAEDLAYASFAGQQDTYLNVVGEEAMLDAVRRCWASLWTDRAVSYRTSNGIDHRSVSLAVVVQRLVDAMTAGTMFTANPVTGTRGEVVVDASPGLGEAVVSGVVNPDHFVVAGRPPAITSRRLGDKRVVVVRRLGGGTEQQPRTDQSTTASLSDDQVLALAALGRRVEAYYGAPQDTEWAIDGDGVLWLTQARPITTLYPLPGLDADPPRIFFCLTLAQGLTRPITPMGLASYRLIGSSVTTAAGRSPADRRVGPRGMEMVGQRLFVDVTPVLANRLGRRLAHAIAGVMEARTAVVIARLAEDPRFPVSRRSPLHILVPVVRVGVFRAQVPVRALAALVSPAEAYRAMARIERRVRASLRVPVGATPEERLERVEQGLSNNLFLVMPRVFGFPAAGFFMLALARRLLRDVATRDEVQVVLRGVPHSVTTEMDLQLWQTTQRIRADADARQAFAVGSSAELVQAYRARALPAVAQLELTAFLRRYGHRAVAEIDLGMPRWSDDPSHIIGVLQNYLRLDDPERAPDAQFEHSRAEAETTLSRLVARLRDQHPRRARIAGFALRRARQLIGLRESPKNILVIALGLMRAQLQQVGAAAAERGALDAADDIFFLDLAEAARAVRGESMRHVVAERRAAYAVELRRRRIPRVLLSDGTEPEAVTPAAGRPDGALSGSPASVGTVTGRARVVLDPRAAHLEPGEILVAPSTDPGWTPLFLTAGGLVMEMGGAMSHGAVVAREYGIPAVVGVPDATRVIETGQLVTVDGAAGLVTVQPMVAPGSVAEADPAANISV
jgi:phosphohistidine swiveling domain-containing protein